MSVLRKAFITYIRPQLQYSISSWINYWQVRIRTAPFHWAHPGVTRTFVWRQTCCLKFKSH